MLEPQLARSCAGIIAADGQIGATFAGLNIPQSVLYNYPTQEFIQQADSTLAAEITGIADRTDCPASRHAYGGRGGVLLMLAAFAQVHAALPSATCCSSAPFIRRVRPTIQARARLGLANAVKFTGRLPFAEVGRHLQAATVGWIPLEATPKYEKNIPTKLFEYMAYGLPVVSSDLTPVQPYLADGECGLLAASDTRRPTRPLLALLRNPVQAAPWAKPGVSWWRPAIIGRTWSRICLPSTTSCWPKGDGLRSACDPSS